MRFASMPTASTRLLSFSTATTEGSMSTMPRPRTDTRVFAVPRSTAMSDPQELKNMSMSDKRNAPFADARAPVEYIEKGPAAFRRAAVAGARGGRPGNRPNRAQV
jgi:hypothetical protein